MSSISGGELAVSFREGKNRNQRHLSSCNDHFTNLEPWRKIHTFFGEECVCVCRVFLFFNRGVSHRKKCGNKMKKTHCFFRI